MTSEDYYEAVLGYWEYKGCGWAKNAEMHKYLKKQGYNLGHNSWGVWPIEETLQPDKIIVYKTSPKCNWTVRPDSREAFLEQFKHLNPYPRDYNEPYPWD